MILTKKFLDYASKKTAVKQRDLLEKDIILHLILNGLSADERFRSHYAFKGGTCLIKCYLGYYRFSEDLDFSYIQQDDFRGKSENQMRKEISSEIDRLAGIIEAIASEHNLDFRADKKDHHYMEFGGGNKFTTFKIWYESVELSATQFIKVQINYVEKFKYPLKQLEAKSSLADLDEKELKLRHPRAVNIIKLTTVQAYDLREILAEKIRAILTRRGTKARDFIDVYLIQKATGVNPEDIEAVILDKTRFILKYEKYRENLQKKTTDIPALKMGEEQKLLLKPLDDGLEEHIKHLTKYLPHLLRKIYQE
jgi:predicted nucleotidyltransferase component of viral defense system